MSVSLVAGEPDVKAGSASRLSDILSQMMSTSLSKVCLTLTFSLALASKNSNPERMEEGLG